MSTAADGYDAIGRTHSIHVIADARREYALRARRRITLCQIAHRNYVAQHQEQREKQSMDSKILLRKCCIIRTQQHRNVHPKKNKNRTAPTGHKCETTTTTTTTTKPHNEKHAQQHISNINTASAIAITGADSCCTTAARGIHQQWHDEHMPWPVAPLH